MNEADEFELSAVIPVLNGADTIADQLQALADQTYPGSWEVVIADNGSTDDTRSIVDAWRGRLPALRVVDASDRRGRDHACNVGARHARGSFVLFCDADDVADPGWVAAMAKGGETFDLWGGRIDTVRLNDPAGPTWRPVDVKAHLPSLSDHGSRFLPYAPGGNMGVARDRFLELGGFDEELSGAPIEDADLSWRAQLAGLRVGLVPDSVMHVRYRPTTSELRRQYYAWGVSQPMLYRRYRSEGMPRDEARAVFRDWIWMTARLPTLPFDPSPRAAWSRRIGKRWGRLVGSVKHRVVYL